MLNLIYSMLYKYLCVYGEFNNEYEHKVQI